MNILRSFINSIKGGLGVSNRINVYREMKPIANDINRFGLLMGAKNSGLHFTPVQKHELCMLRYNLLPRIHALDKFIDISNEKIKINFNFDNGIEKHNKHIEIITEVEDFKEDITKELRRIMRITKPTKPPRLSKQAGQDLEKIPVSQLKEILEKDIADLGKMITKKEEDIADLKNNFNSFNSRGDRLSFSEKIKELEKLMAADYEKIRNIDAKLDELEKEIEVYCNENEAVLERVYERKNKCQVDNPIEQLREDLLAVAELVSAERGFSLESMPKVPNLVGSDEDIESLINFKNKIIDFISMDIFSKEEIKTKPTQGPLAIVNANLDKAKDIYESAFNKIKTDKSNRTNNGENWKTIISPFVHKLNTFISKYIPVQELRLSPTTDNTFGQNVGSTATKSKHVTNAWLSEFSVAGKVLSRLFRHGALSASGLKLGSKARKEANIARGKELLTAMLLADPKKLEIALSGKVPKLRFPSINLMTPANVKVPGFESRERILCEEQNAVLEYLSSEPEITLTIVDANGQSQDVRVDADIAAFSIGVNPLARGWPKLGQNFSDQCNKKAALKLLVKLEHPSIGGWVEEYLAGKNITNREKVIKLAIELKMALRNKEYHQSNGDPYRIPALIAILSQEIGLDPCVNCKSGKDRTAFAVARIAEWRAKEYMNLQPGEEDSYIRGLLMADPGSGKIQELNTGHRGNKAATKNKFTLRRLAEWFIGGEEMREYIGNPNVLEVVVGDSEKASKDKKKKSEPLEPNPIPLQGSVASQRLVESMPGLQELILRRGSSGSSISNLSDESSSTFGDYDGDSEDGDEGPGDGRVMLHRSSRDGSLDLLTQNQAYVPLESLIRTSQANADSFDESSSTSGDSEDGGVEPGYKRIIRPKSRNGVPFKSQLQHEDSIYETVHFGSNPSIVNKEKVVTGFVGNLHRPLVRTH
ncbi:inositol phosphate phosphatase SopB [Candidatus Regiella insecticola]|uniref:Enterobacterial virulence protein IpgD n=1 Tax=Candidatus Regiella insecticola TaxID=138073 RepID=A0A6L2ZQ28_9ENTR|nr:inositol phosphate phosphatase SopB [Candidatus Regiella insecticola]GFN46652.1 enterobacterial virulence protein IpgD [Candidatus Regiella insecticola]